MVKLINKNININKLQFNKDSITEPKFTFNFGSIRHAVIQTSELPQGIWCEEQHTTEHTAEVYPYIGGILN